MKILGNEKFAGVLIRCNCSAYKSRPSYIN